MRFLRTNTAVIVTVGPFYDKTDGVTIETALTITNERITLTADTDAGSAPTNILDNITGATSGTANDLNYITGNDAGIMQLELAAADVNRLGRMFLSITDAANHVPVFHEFMVVNAALYDAFFASSGGAIPNVAAAAVGGLVTAPTTANTALADVTRLLGTAWLAPGTAGTPDVNTKLWNGLTTVALPLIPTTAGRTLDVSTTGEAGLDWANIGSPTTAQNLSATNIDVDQVVASVSGAVGSVAGAVGSVTGAVGSVTGSVGSVTGLTVSNLDATVSSRLASASYTTPPTAVENADALLDRNMATGADSGSTTVRTVRQALRFLRNKWSISGTTLTVCKEDDSTTSFTSVVTPTVGASPITAVDPAGP